MAQADHIVARRAVSAILVKLYDELDTTKFNALLETERQNLTRLGRDYLDKAVKAMGINRFTPEPAIVTMPSAEQVLLYQLTDIHPELGLWAIERFQQGFDAVSVRNHLGALMNTVER